MIKLLLLPFKLVGFGVRLAGVRNSLLLAVGVCVGLLIAPETGAELRARLRERLEGRGGSDRIPDDADLSL